MESSVLPGFLQHHFEQGKASMDRVVVRTVGRQVFHKHPGLRGGRQYDRDFALRTTMVIDYHRHYHRIAGRC